MTSPLPAPPACPLYESLRRHRGHTSINANAGHQNEGDAASSDRVSRNLLFVLLGPLFPPQRFPFSQLMNISLQPVLIHSILDKIQLHPGELRGATCGLTA
ncbi:hypothetical protein AB1Y20_020276 [Prymnesium parvum]|uniref:Uncharacterized protein n=1 Tax=Prymnesium parvum TaxID=97485 RepID=A0AB34JWY3_PRYPA